MADNSPNEESLAGWVMERVNAWEEWRKNNFDERWDEYYRMWRGFWTEADKNRESERSRIICPELAQSIESCVAELEDATFIRERWIDIRQDVDDERKKELEQYTNLLMDDFSEYGVNQAIAEAFLNAALYGTGIGKVVVDKIEEPVIEQGAELGAIVFEPQYRIRLVPIAPRNFVIDPSARNVDEALGCAHVTKVPLTVIHKRIAEGIYNSFPVTDYQQSVEDLQALAELDLGPRTASCKLVEWHGLVPKRFINESEKLFDELDEALNAPTLDTTLKAVGEAVSTADEEMVEALVVIINDEHVAKAVQNPFLFGDRSIVAYQHDTVPNRFWGRGVAEKGYNSQKALDAEIRARIDALAFSVHPMMGVDATKIPRGVEFGARPGRNFFTNGNPAEILMPIKFPPPDPHTFSQTQELREMIQRATGGYELPAMVEDANRMAATSMSMVVGGMIKRSRRTLSNIEREFLSPLVKKALYRYMQFDSKRFPMQDYHFVVKASMGIMAREFEQGQFISLLSTVPPESPAYWMLIKGIYENSTIKSREEMLEFADQMLESAKNPQPPPPDPKAQAALLELELKRTIHNDEMEVRTMELVQERRRADAGALQAEKQGELDSAKAVLSLIQAQTEKMTSSAEAFKAVMEGYARSIEAQAAKMQALASFKTETSTTEGVSNTPTTKADGTTSEKATAETNTTESSTDLEAIKAVTESAEMEPVVEEDKVATILEEMLGLMKVQNTVKPEKKEKRAFDKKEADLSGLPKSLEDISSKLEMLLGKEQSVGPVDVERDEQGLVTSVNGRPIKRDGNGRISGIE